MNNQLAIFHRPAPGFAILLLAAAGLFMSNAALHAQDTTTSSPPTPYQTAPDISSHGTGDTSGKHQVQSRPQQWSEHDIRHGFQYVTDHAVRHGFDEPTDHAIRHGYDEPTDHAIRHNFDEPTDDAIRHGYEQ